MKKKNLLVYLLIAMMSMVATFTSCKDDDVKKEKETTLELFNGKEIGDGSSKYVVKAGEYHLAKGTYYLKGKVYLADGAVLTIAPGTIIKGDKDTEGTLIVQRGAKLYAIGTKEEPIVFTSAQPKGQRKPGDWGGIVLLGKARHNQTQDPVIEGGLDAYYGGDNDDDSSGELRYVRIEFPGFPYAPNQEINGLTMGAVGRGTKINYVQVSYCNDDAFEFFGGCVNATHLIAYHTWDDDFDTDFGYNGHIQYAVAIRHPRIADTSWSSAFESDNDGDGSTLTPYTSAVFSNFTLVGPMAGAADFKNDPEYITGGNMKPNNGSKLGTFFGAMHIRRNSRLSVFNSVALGFPVGLGLDNAKGTTQTWATEGSMKIQNNLFAGMGIVGTDVYKKTTPIYSTNGKDGDETKEPFSTTFFQDAKNNNRVLADMKALKLKNYNSLQGRVDLRPAKDSPLMSGASFSDSFLSTGNIFTKTSYIGAFRADEDWTAGWANFDPQNTDYPDSNN